MQHRARHLVAVVLSSLLVPACASEPTTDADSARTGWRSTELALNEAGIQAAWSGSGTVSPDGVSGMVMGTVECPDGGSMEVDAVGDVTSESSSGAVSISFHGCVVDDVRIDGSLEYEGSVTATSVRGSIHGDLEWSGAAEGTCAIDIEAEVTTDGTRVGAYAVGGSMCGHDWSDLY